MRNYQGRGLCYLPQPKAEADKTNRGHIILHIQQERNSIILLLSIFVFANLSFEEAICISPHLA